MGLFLSFVKLNQFKIKYKYRYTFICMFREIVRYGVCVVALTAYAMGSDSKQQEKDDYTGLLSMAYIRTECGIINEKSKSSKNAFVATKIKMNAKKEDDDTKNPLEKQKKDDNNEEIKESKKQSNSSSEIDFDNLKDDDIVGAIYVNIFYTLKDNSAAKNLKNVKAEHVFRSLADNLTTKDGNSLEPMISKVDKKGKEAGESITLMNDEVVKKSLKENIIDSLKNVSITEITTCIYLTKKSFNDILKYHKNNKQELVCLQIRNVPIPEGSIEQDQIKSEVETKNLYTEPFEIDKIVSAILDTPETSSWVNYWVYIILGCLFVAISCGAFAFWFGRKKND